MKSQLVSLFLLSTCLAGYSQFEYYKPDTTRNHHRDGDFIVSASSTVLLRTTNGIQIAGGIKMQLFLSKRFSLDGDFVFGSDYFHSGPGLIGLPLGLIAMGSVVENGGVFFWR